MFEPDSIRSPFRIRHEFLPDAARSLAGLLSPVVERALSLRSLERRYLGIADADTPAAFIQRALEALGVAYTVHPDPAKVIPASGPLIVAANHPYGLLEGIILARLIGSVRPDLRILANSLLCVVPALTPLLIPVNPFGGPNAARANVRPLRDAHRWLRGGGALLIFPAGEVAHARPATAFRVTETAWKPTVVRLARETGASILPAHVSGANGPLFQLAGLLHPGLRTALLPRELLSSARRRICIELGTTVRADLLVGLDDRAAISHLRLRVHSLGTRSAPSLAAGGQAMLTPRRRIVDGIPPDRLSEEISSLPPGTLLLRSGSLEVYAAMAQATPSVLAEIGRLREITFRAAGEGTGRETDRDDFDRWYLHLFLWDRDSRQVAGAYRLARTDRIVARIGLRGLYTRTLFRYGRRFVRAFSPSLELGRSFIRSEYQRSFAPLMLLWRGIGAVVARDPSVRYLFGPVSISGDFSPFTRQIMAEYLLQRHGMRDRSLVRSRRPLRRPDSDCRRALTTLRDLDDLSNLISGIEPDGKGIPVLIRQYLKLGGRLASFSIDPAFHGAVDGLILVDLLRTDRRMLDRYLGEQGATSLLTYHGALRSASPPALAAAVI